jgi:two-component system OmpR family sensor kinase
MSLSRYEKRSLVRFLLIYLISTYTFIFILAGMFYSIEKRNIYENHALKLNTIASSIAHKIITAHMMNDDALKACLKNESIAPCFNLEKNYQISLFDAQKKSLHVGFSNEVDFAKRFYREDDSFLFVDDSAQNHLGVQFVVIKELHISRFIHALQNEIIVYLLMSLVFATLLGLVLARLFVKPIREHIETLNTFIKDSTHELNTPVTAILMSVSTLKDVDEKKRRRIEQSAKRIATLYGNLSYILLHDKQNEEKSDVDVKKLIEERIEYFADLMASKRIDLTLNLSEKTLQINPESLAKLIDNLISNAIKYNRIAGAIAITLDESHLSVSDTGIGIAPEKIASITQRYKRANSDKGGFGIGLDIVSTICKTNGFRLLIDSKLNVGSCFSIYF